MQRASRFAGAFSGAECALILDRVVGDVAPRVCGSERVLLGYVCDFAGLPARIPGEELVGCSRATGVPAAAVVKPGCRRCSKPVGRRALRRHRA